MKTLAGVGLILAGAVIYGNFHFKRLRALQRDGVPVTGWVTGKSAGDDKLVHYAFRANDQVKTGHDLTGEGTPDFTSIKVGDEIIVFYDRQNPDISCLGDPKERLRTGHNAFVYLLIATVPLIALALRRELARASA